LEINKDNLARWESTKNLLSLNLGVPQYKAYIESVELRAVSGDIMVLQAPNILTGQVLRGRFYSMLTEAVKRNFGRELTIQIALEDEVQQLIANLSSNMLNRAYTFDNFVVGHSNTFAYSAAVAVAESPSEQGAYNPLFIYGGVGLGKTHLMNAIGNYIAENSPDKSVFYVSSETFTNEFITAIKKKETAQLREKIRKADVFMVDDIQFLSKTVSTQEEFFHTFNDLHQKGKQIILSSDRPPSEIPAIEERLRTRFGWGLTVDIRKPDFETRVAILKRKCDDEGLDFPMEVLEFIAERVDSNIRGLEGALNTLKARSELMGGRVTLEYAMDTLERTLPAKKAATVTAQSIMTAVAERYAVTPEDMISKKRNREYTLPRQIVMFLLRDILSMSTTAIGQELGGRDHTTVMHGCEKMEAAMKSDSTFRRSIDELKEAIKAG